MLASTLSEARNRGVHGHTHAGSHAVLGVDYPQLRSKTLRSGHDVSDGGLLTAILEMAIAGNIGVDLTLPAPPAQDSAPGAALAAAFAEELGLVVEVGTGTEEAALLKAMSEAKVPCVLLGKANATRRVTVTVDGSEGKLDATLASLRDTWEATSFELEKLQCEPTCVAQEQAGLSTRDQPGWTLSFTPAPTPAAVLARSPSQQPAVAVLRQEGSNGDREMAAALYAAGLSPWDVTMSDLVEGRTTLDRFRGLVCVGGFSYADVLGSAKGWAGVLQFNPGLAAQLATFRSRKDTFSLGVCNGCQLMALLGWVPGASEAGGAQLPVLEQPRFVHNASGRFESRFSSVKILPSPAVLLKGMEGTSMGVWVAHGEGRAHFPEPKILEGVLDKGLAPIRYVDDANVATEAYPHNPNGSVHGIAALTSEDGRHLAMMPHPERCFLPWQWPWTPSEWASLQAGPWLRLFQNARAFCEGEA